MESNGTRAAIYARISRDDEGEGLGIARQEAACRQLAERLGWTVIGVYADNSKSAYDRRKARPQYERMLIDVQSGRVNGVLCFALDRLTRHPMELERLVEVFVSHRTAVQTVAGGELDLNTEEGQLRARITGSVARFESGRKSERLKAKAAQMIADGKRPCGGPRPFGYDRHYDDPDSPRRRILKETINEQEAAAIRDAAERLLRGESMRSIVGEWNDRGLLTSRGNRWSLTSFRQMMTSGRLAGLLMHNRQVVNGVTAQWPAILDRETHEQLHALLTKRGRPGGGNARKFWLTGHVYCSCGVSMRVGKAKNGRRRYECLPRKEGGCGARVVDLDELDRMISKLVIKRLQDPGILADLARRESTTQGESRALLDAIERDERRLVALRADLEDEDTDPDDILETRAAIRKVRGRIKRRRDELSRLAGAEPLVGVDVDDLADRWERIDLPQKAGLLRVAGIERVVIYPTKLRGRFDPDRVDLVPVPS
ncbi:MAG: recombinase family protein [Actinomadura sp.]